jgi:hypothetical protein
MLDELPHPAPSFEGKPTDFGLLDGRPVAIDYAVTADILQSDRERWQRYAKRA